MKKILLIAILIVAAAVLAACGGGDDTYNNGNGGDEVVASPTPPAIVIQQAQPNTTPPPIVAQGHVRRGLTREGFIDDLDFFMNFLETHFLHFDVVYMRFGVDFRQNAADLRAVLADEDFEIDAYTFTQLMLDNFFMHPDITYSVANWHMAGQSQRSDSFDDTGEHVETNVLEEGRIGYIRINCFELQGFGVRGNAARAVRSFFEDSADFEHIIIDIRGVDGGTADAWEHAIIAPNLTEEVTQTFHVFDVFGVWPQILHAQMTPFAAFAGAQTGIDARLPAGGVFTIADMDAPPPYLNLDLGLVYGLTYSRIIAPVADVTPFAGQIWLLIDSGVGGAVAQFASLAEYAGVAKLVGQPIGGDMGVIVPMLGRDGVFFVSGDRYSGLWSPGYLPNAGILFGFSTAFQTDHLGRSLCEYMTQPHVHVPDDVDALEYLLDLIG